MEQKNIVDLLYKDESYAIRGALMKVYNTLGAGFSEQVYQEALQVEFLRQDIPFEREVDLDIYYDGIKLRTHYRADFICYDKIIIELKAVSALDDGNRAQTRNYLKATGYKLAFLVNFGNNDGIEIERRLG